VDLIEGGCVCAFILKDVSPFEVHPQKQYLSHFAGMEHEIQNTVHFVIAA